MEWQKTSEEERLRVLTQIPKHWLIASSADHDGRRPKDLTGGYIQSFLSTFEVEITETSTSSLLYKLAIGEWSARQVVEAFCHRAAIAHQLVPCVTEFLFTSALSRADELDAQFKPHVSVLGTLHGLPVSLKDQVQICGTDSATGVISYLGSPSTETSQIVVDLVASGAVPIVKTTVPQFSFSLETQTNIHGYTFNPVNPALSAGGSSGGEGALLALKGAALGWGTDIGGSIRVPAAFNGLYGLKPSTQRLPFKGVRRVGDGQAGGTPFAIGPIAASADALAIATRALLAGKPWLRDPELVQLPWRQETYMSVSKIAKGKEDTRKLRFGILRDDGICRPQPPVKRAIDLTVDAIKKLGHEVVEWTNPPSHSVATRLVYSTWLFDGGREAHAALEASGEPATDAFTALWGSDISAHEATASVISKTNIEIRNWRSEYAEYWNEMGIDAMIAPVSPYAAPLIGKFRYLGYTPWLNILDYSVAVIPVLQAHTQLDVYPTGQYAALNNQDQICHDEYDPAVFHGSPVGLQIVGRRFEEEKVCALAEVLGEAIREEQVAFPAPEDKSSL